MGISRRVLVPLIVACALFMEHMDSTVLSTSLPAIAADMGENPLALKLALTSYLISLAVFLPASGWVADRYGSRTVFAWAMGVFMLGSLLCAASSTLAQFVGARFVQGMGGAMMAPVGRLVLLKSVPKSRLVGAMNIVMIPAMLGPLLGPPLGGFITEYFHWRGIFLINVPVSIVGITLALAYVPNIRESEVRPFDVRGFALSALGLSFLVFGLSALGGHLLTDNAIAAFITTGLLALAAYWRHSRRALHPALNLDLLKVATFRAGVVGGTLFRIGAGAVPFLLPLLFQLGFGLSPLQSGLLTCASAVGALLIRSMSIVVLKRFGFRRVLMANAAVSSLGVAVYGLFASDTPYEVIFFVLLITGGLRALQFTINGAIAYADVTRELMSQATSLSSVAQRIAQSLGVVVGAYALELSSLLQGHATVVAGDFWPAFLALGIISGLSIVFFHRLPENAGAEVSGHARE
jgi:EmrB/QacA subfamily drug resistance transporter